MNNKPIDLGALQDALRQAKAIEKASQRLLEAAQTKLAQAILAEEKARAKLASAVEQSRDMKRAVLEGARQVANG